MEAACDSDPSKAGHKVPTLPPVRHDLIRHPGLGSGRRAQEYQQISHRSRERKARRVENFTGSEDEISRGRERVGKRLKLKSKGMQRREFKACGLESLQHGLRRQQYSDDRDMVDLVQESGAHRSPATRVRGVLDRGDEFTALRGSLIAAEWLSESRLPWQHFIPVVVCGLPDLVRCVGPVQVCPPEHPALIHPKWYPVHGVPDPVWLEFRQTLEVAARLLPQFVAQALDHDYFYSWTGQPGPGELPRLTWDLKPDLTGGGALAHLYLFKARQLGLVPRV